MSPDAVFRIGTTTVAVVALELLEAPTPAIVVASNNWLQPEPGSLASDVMTRAGDAYAADLRAAVADRKSTRLNSSHVSESRMPSSA